MGMRGSSRRIHGQSMARWLCRIGFLTLVAIVLQATVTLSIATAAERSVPATRSVIATITIEGYDVDFTLPTAAKAGCLVCHGDPGLTRLKEGQNVSFYVDPTMVADSAHAGVQCTGCHLDFAFTYPHEVALSDWRSVAASACKNCHQDQFLAYGRSSHRREPDEPLAAKDEIAKPLCADCHGSHDIAMLTDNPRGQQALHAAGYRVCGECHQEYWDNYDDYYHGAAYKRGASDSPACWDCHSGHELLVSTDKDSTVNERHLVETCSACHSGVTEDYTAYSPLIHGRSDYRDGVFLSGVYAWIKDTFLSVFGG